MDFTDWYEEYPRKEARREAEKAWGKLTDVQQTKALSVIPMQVRLWRHEGRERKYIPLPATYLNGWRFDDELELPREMPKLPPRPGESMEEWQQRCRQARV